MTFLTVKKENALRLKNSSLFIPAKELLLQLLPLEYRQLISSEANQDVKDKVIGLQQKLPLIKFTSSDQAITIKILSFADKNSETASFIHEMLSKNLVLEKQMNIDASFFINFSFPEADFLAFFLGEYTLQLKNEKERKAVLQALPYFLDRLKINLLALYSARHLTKMQNIELSSFLYKRTKQKNLLQIKENLTRLMNRRFVSTDANLFETIKNLTLLFNENFTSQKDPRYISKLIAFIYLFKKLYSSNSPERQIRLKLFKNIHPDPEKKNTVAGILVSLNINAETERFEKKHLMQAVKSCIPYAHAIKDSWIQDSSENFKIFYLEIEKSNAAAFTLDEIKILKAYLAEEIKEHIEKLLSPIFMPRNEEEVLRNIILLSKQLKYVRDLPQMIISYDKQTEKELIFQVILLRILRKKHLPLEELFAKAGTYLKFIPEEVKIIGVLKKKYPKEANLFKISVKKDPYFRKDFSLDLQKARHSIVSEMNKIIGDIRDFNGGMIFKQSQSFLRLKKELPELTGKEEFLLENFFFSLKPVIQQSILDIEVLKAFFLLFLHVLKSDLSEQKFLIKTLSMPNYILIMIGSEDGSFKKPIEEAVKKLKLSPFDLTSFFYQKQKNYLMGYIYKVQELAKHSLFYHVLLNALSGWKKNS